MPRAFDPTRPPMVLLEVAKRALEKALSPSTTSGTGGG